MFINLNKAILSVPGTYLVLYKWLLIENSTTFKGFRELTTKVHMELWTHGKNLWLVFMLLDLEVDSTLNGSEASCVL